MDFITHKLLVLTKKESNCSSLPFNGSVGDKDEMVKLTDSLAAANNIWKDFIESYSSYSTLIYNLWICITASMRS